MKRKEKNVMVKVIGTFALILLMFAAFLAVDPFDTEKESCKLNKGTSQGAEQALIDSGFINPELISDSYEPRSTNDWHYQFKATNPLGKVVNVTVTHNLENGYTVRFKSLD